MSPYLSSELERHKLFRFITHSCASETAEKLNKNTNIWAPPRACLQCGLASVHLTHSPDDCEAQPCDNTTGTT